MTVDQITEEEAELRAWAERHVWCPACGARAKINNGTRTGLTFVCDSARSQGCRFRWSATFATLLRALRDGLR